MDELIKKVEQWVIDRGLDKQDPKIQMCKVMEELGELASGLCKNDVPKQVDSLGDVLVTLICLALQANIPFVGSLAFAYEVIKDRKGKLIDGVFVKEEDL